MKKKTGATPLFELENARISIFQEAILYLTFVISTIDIFLPYLTVLRAGRDGWISVFISILETLPIAANAIALTLRFPRRTLIEYSQIALGLWPGRLVGLLFIVYVLSLGATVVRELEEIMSIAFLTHTPKIVFGTAVILLSIYVVRSGVEVICRVNGILMPLGLFFLFFVGLTVLPRADFARYLPVLENGLKPPVSGSLILLSFLTEGALVLSVVPFAERPRKVIGSAAIQVPLLGGALLMGTISIAVFGLEETRRVLMPALELARLVEIPGLPRSDVLILTGWYAGIFIKIAAAHYFLTIFTAQWAGLKSYKPLIMPLGVVMVSLSLLMFDNINDLVQFIGGPLIYFLLTFQFAVPLVILIVSWLRGVEEKERA